MRHIKACAFVGIFFLICCIIATDVNSATDNRITVEADGTGSTKMEALKSAWENAVRQAVGMYMTSKTEMLNDNLTEELAAYSRGQVNSYKTLSESQNNGIWTIKIQANIDRDIMQETVKASKSQNIQIDGSNLAAQMQSQNNKNQDAKDVIRVGDMLNFQEALKYEVSLQSYNNGEAIFARHILKFDLKKFQSWADTLEKFVAQRAIKKEEVKLKPDAAKRALAFITATNYPLQPNLDMLEDDKRILTRGTYVVCTNDANQYPSWVENLYPETMRGWTAFMFEKMSSQKNTITFLKNQSKATRYLLSEEAYKDIQVIHSRYQLNFYIEAGEGYNAISEPTQRKLFFTFPPTPSLTHGRTTENIFIVPDFNIGEHSADHTFQCPVLFVFQKLDIPVDRIAELKNITGKYT